MLKQTQNQDKIKHLLLRSYEIKISRQTLKYLDKIKNLLTDSKNSLESCQEADKTTA